jgi:hypothetical protein
MQYLYMGLISNIIIGIIWMKDNNGVLASRDNLMYVNHWTFNTFIQL